jgi:hypothetical protein
MFIWAGASDFDSGLARFKQVIDKLQSCHDVLGSKTHFAQQLVSAPEPSWLEKRFIQGVFRYLPTLLRYGAKEMAQTAADELPPLLPGRHGPDAYQKAEIVAAIGHNILHGCNAKQGIMRATKQFKLSKSTIQRIWDDRQNPGEVDFWSVLKYLKDDGKALEQAGRVS